MGIYLGLFQNIYGEFMCVCLYVGISADINVGICFVIYMGDLCGNSMQNCILIYVGFKVRMYVDVEVGFVW